MNISNNASCMCNLNASHCSFLVSILKNNQMNTKWIQNEYKNNVCISLPVYSSVQNMTIWPFICLNSYKEFEIFFELLCFLKKAKQNLQGNKYINYKEGIKLYIIHWHIIPIIIKFPVLQMYGIFPQGICIIPIMAFLAISIQRSCKMYYNIIIVYTSMICKICNKQVIQDPIYEKLNISTGI